MKKKLEKKIYECGCVKYFFQYGTAHVICGKPRGQCKGFGITYYLKVKARPPEWHEYL